MSVVETLIKDEVVGLDKSQHITKEAKDYKYSEKEIRDALKIEDYLLATRKQKNFKQ